MLWPELLSWNLDLVLDTEFLIKFITGWKDFETRSRYFVFMFRDGVVLDGGAPYATDNTVRIPSGRSICPSGCTFNQDAMRHETFHTVRAKYDGSKAHFLIDVARFL